MKHIVNTIFILLFLLSSQCQSVKSNNTCGDCRILTPFIKKGQASIAKSNAKVPSDQFLGLESYTGFITVKEEYGSNLFFWFYPSIDGGSLENTPWIIWLQGGPGYSSMYGLFNLVGPMKIENGQVKYRNTTLASKCSMLFIDNPVGAGYSFTTKEEGYVDNEDDVGTQMLEFLAQFLLMFPELRAAPLFIAGESYAGKYIPALGYQIHRHKNEPGRDINLKGLIIGGGMINPGLMMQYSELVSALGILDEAETNNLRIIEQSAVQLLREGRMVDSANKFNETIEFIKIHSTVSVYNFLQDPTPNTKAPEFEAFIQKPDVRKAIGAGNVTFDMNNQKVYEKMLPDIMNSTLPFVEELLDHYPVLCYHGQQDIIMAYSLAMHTYRSLRWNRWQQYYNATRAYLKDSNNSTLAYVKSGGGFTEMLVRHAGHMAPADVPELLTYIYHYFIDEHK